MRSSGKARIASVIAGTIVLAVGCGDNNSDRAGGTRTAKPVVLTMAQGNDGAPEQLVAWANEVAARSNGTVRIEFSNLWRGGETDYEVGTIKDVQAGKADLAWVGARAFDRVGVTTFEPLLAPLLVDSQDLQGAVFEAGLPTQMLTGLDKLDVVGLGVLPGPMRKMMGVDRPFVRPKDFDGAVIGISGSRVATQTMEVLGATPQDLPTGAELDGLDAMEQQLASIQGNNYALKGAHFVTTNLNMWPRPLVMFMNTKRFESLSGDQQTALRDAAGAAVGNALADSRAEDTNAVSLLCADAMTFAVASDDDLATLRTALEPVYQQIAGDATNRERLDEIVALKNKVGVPPDTAECPVTEPTAAETTEATEGSRTDAFPEGTFETTITSDDSKTRCGTDPGFVEVHLDVTFADGHVEQWETPTGGKRDLGFRATYTVFRDRVEFHELGAPQGTLSFRWTFDGTTLVLSDLEDDHGECTHHVIWETNPWTLAEPTDPSGG